ncbi:MAG: peptidoglycan DD-metalloendopeptidase family protein [Paracoccaceae bacterium]|nr:peptidoglycan DD-metalloendopeptidase family protein [Paracoccaceae bacterium]
MRLAFATAVLTAISSMTAAAETDAEAIARHASELLAGASLSLTDADSEEDRVAALSETVRAYEVGLEAMREGLRAATFEARVKREALSGRDSGLIATLLQLQALERFGPAQAFVHPEGALSAIRAGMLASDAAPALNAEAVELAGELADLKAVASLRDASRQKLQTGLQEVRDARLLLSAAIAARTDRPAPLATDDAAMVALIDATETLSAFADSLSETASVAAGAAHAGWALPARGQILRGFEEPDAGGIRRPGWILATAPEALVAAPTQGTIRFAGVLPDQGGVAILEPNPGEIVILSGLGDLFVVRDQIVSVGEPIGFMGRSNATPDQKLNEIVTDSGQPSSETLYIEVRQSQKPVDPKTRFRAGIEEG